MKLTRSVGLGYPFPRSLSIDSGLLLIRLATGIFLCTVFDYAPSFIKLSLSKFTTGKMMFRAVEYSMVNENDRIPMMANGWVVKLASGTHYVQLTSTRPISDSIPRDLLRQLAEHEART